MIFWASSEVHQPAGEASEVARRSVEPYLNRALAASSLSDLPGELRYVPIIMPAELIERYPARSKLRKNVSVYVCAPQLDYHTFVDGSLGDQLTEYIRGIMLSAPYLSGLGATREQIEEFRQILQGAVARILIERPDQTRH